MTRMAELQRRDFVDRIHRIQKGGPNTQGTIYAGPAEAGGVQYTQPSKNRKPRGSFLKELILLPFAVVVGAVSMLAGRAGSYHIQAQPEMVPAQYAELFAVSADWVIAAVLATILAWSFRMGHGLRCVALVAGFLAVMLGETMLVERAPDAFAAVFSPEYVADMQTMPNALDALGGLDALDAFGT